MTGGLQIIGIATGYKPGCSDESNPFANPITVKVMTHNVFGGSEMGDIIDAPTVSDVPVITTWPRIVLLFAKGLVQTTAATRTGVAGARTPSGKLASDHLGVAFTLRIGR